MSVSKRLKMVRKAKGISQTQVYKDTGINNKTLSGYERGISEPDLRTLKMLARYYDVSIDYLLDNINDIESYEEEYDNGKSHELGGRLKQLREKNKLTREELADKLGVSYSTIAKYESNTREPDIETLIELSYLFDVSIDWIVGRTLSDNLAANHFLKNDKDLQSIAKAKGKMPAKDVDKMMNMLKLMFEEYFID